MKNNNNYFSRSHTLTSSASQILALNQNRVSLIIFNTGANPAVFNIGTGDITLAAGDHVAFLDRPPINAITASSVSGTTLVSWEA